MRNAAATRDRILDAAAAILAEAGPSGFGINAVCRKAGIGKPLLYRYFGGLDGLIEALSQQAASHGKGDEKAEKNDLLHRLIGSGRALSRDRLARDLLRLALEGRGYFRLDEPPAPPRQEASHAETLHAETQAILLAGTLFLLLWRDHHTAFAGVPLETPRDMAKLENAAAALLRSIESPELNESRKGGGS